MRYGHIDFDHYHRAWAERLVYKRDPGTIEACRMSACPELKWTRRLSVNVIMVRTNEEKPNWQVYRTMVRRLKLVHVFTVQSGFILSQQFALDRKWSRLLRLCAHITGKTKQSLYFSLRNIQNCCIMRHQSARLETMAFQRDNSVLVSEVIH